MVGSEIPSLPIELMRHESRLRERDPRQRRPCFLVPAPHEIAVANDKWQVFRNYPAEYQAYLHGAHYDDRDRKRPMVRILALIDRCKKKFRFLSKFGGNYPVAGNSNMLFYGWGGLCSGRGNVTNI